MSLQGLTRGGASRGGRRGNLNPWHGRLLRFPRNDGFGIVEVVMRKVSATNWRLDRRINLSVLLQLMVLASMILASWVNLQRQLDLLQHDVSVLLQSQKEFQQKLESLSHQSISCEYRLQAMERQLDSGTTKASR
jgi:Tfp pilus assembly protein PilO